MSCIGPAVSRGCLQRAHPPAPETTISRSAGYIPGKARFTVKVTAVTVKDRPGGSRIQVMGFRRSGVYLDDLSNPYGYIGIQVGLVRASRQCTR